MSETTKTVSHSFISRVLPLLGLCAAIIVNAAWIGFLGYWFFRLVIWASAGRAQRKGSAAKNDARGVAQRYKDVEGAAGRPFSFVPAPSEPVC